MTFHKFSTATGLISSLFLAACGGGGSTSTAPTTSTTTTTTPTPTSTGAITVGGALVGKIARVYSDNTLTTFAGLTATSTSVKPTVTSSALTSITVSYTESGVSASQTISSLGIVSGGITSMTSGTYTNMLGGTTYIYSRFGYSEYASINSGNSAQIDDRLAPFYVATVYSGVTPPSATYTGKLTGVFAISNASRTRVTCDVSVAYTAGTTKTVVPTISNCTDGSTAYTASGSISSSTTGNTVSLTIPTSAKLSFANSGTPSITMTAVSVNGFDAVIGGPNGEEIVGSANVLGEASVNGNAVTGTFVFSFGAKK